MKRVLRTTGLILGLIMISVVALAEPPAFKLRVDGLACPFCAYGIEKELSSVEGVESIDIDIKEGVVIVTMADGVTLDETVARKAIEDAGFDLRSFERGSDE